MQFTNVEPLLLSLVVAIAVAFGEPSRAASRKEGVNSTATPSVYWVENVFEVLETPGQWYLNRPQGRLYYLPRPGEDMTTAEMIAPQITQVVRIIGRPGAPPRTPRSP
jgi:hypothetical protein